MSVTKICNTCAEERPIVEFECVFRTRSEGFKNCSNCRRGYRYYTNRKKDDDYMKLTDYRAYGRPKVKEKAKAMRIRSMKALNKQCFDCIYLHCKYWDCIHDDRDKFIVFSDKRRENIQAIEDYDEAYAFYRKNQGVRNIDKMVNKIKQPSKKKKIDKIPIDKFTLKIII